MAFEVVTDNEFEGKILNNRKVVVKFFADWCGSCKLFAPKYKRLAGDNRFSDILFLDVNAEKNPVARKMSGVSTLPFFAVFKDGKLLETVSATKEEAIVELINKLN
jgi:thioredoxin 1